MVWNIVALVVFAGIIVLTFVFLWSWRGLLVAGCIPMANVFIMLGRQLDPPLWSISPFLSPAIIIVMLVLLAFCWMPILLGEYFV